MSRPQYESDPLEIIEQTQWAWFGLKYELPQRDWEEAKNLMEASFQPGYKILTRAGEGKEEPTHIGVVGGVDVRHIADIKQMALNAAVRLSDVNRIGSVYFDTPDTPEMNFHIVCQRIRSEKIQTLRDAILAKYPTPSMVYESLFVVMYTVEGTLKLKPRPKPLGPQTA